MNTRVFLAMLEVAAQGTKDLVDKLQEAGRTDYALTATLVNATFAVARGVALGAQESIAVLERIATAQEATAHELDGAFDQFVAKPLEGLAPRWVRLTSLAGAHAGAPILIQATAVRVAHSELSGPGTLLVLGDDVAMSVVVKESLDDVYRLLTGLGPAPKNDEAASEKKATGAEVLAAWDAARPEGLSDESVQAILEGTGRSPLASEEDEG